MGTAAIPGFDGQVYVSKDGGTNFDRIGELREMTLNLESELFDATSHDSGGWRENIGGLKNWGISAETLYIEDDVGQDVIFDALVGAIRLEIQFRPRDSVGDDEFFGAAHVATYEQADPNDDVAATSLELTGTATLARGTIV